MAQTTTDRVSDREIVVRRRFQARPAAVFQAWTVPDLMRRWWVPESFGITLLSLDMDPRTGGRYRFVFAHPSGEGEMAFVGQYLDVVPDTRLVWTNEESPDGAVTTVTLTEHDGGTELVLTELYPNKAALDEAIESGSTGAYGEQFDALDALLGA